MAFRNNRFLYLTPVLFFIAITALPLLTTKWIGLEKSLYLMYLIDFFTGIVVVTFIYKENWKFGSATTFITLLIIIFFIQIVFYVKRVPNFDLLQISRDHIIPYLFAVFVIPFAEECIYRGCLFDFFLVIFKNNVIWPVALSSIIFCGMHTQYTRLLDFTVLFFASIIFCLSRIKSGSLLPPVLLHSFMNAFVILLSNLDVF